MREAVAAIIQLREPLKKSGREREKKKKNSSINTRAIRVGQRHVDGEVICYHLWAGDTVKDFSTNRFVKKHCVT